MKTQPMKPNPETPNRKLLRLAREIVQAWAAQGKEFTVEDVAHTLFDNTLLVKDEKERAALLACLAREGCFQFAYDEWQDWRDLHPLSRDE